MTLGRKGHYASLRAARTADTDMPFLGPNQGQYATLSKGCKTLESSDFYWNVLSQPGASHGQNSSLSLDPLPVTTDAASVQNSGGVSQHSLLLGIVLQNWDPEVRTSRIWVIWERRMSPNKRRKIGRPKTTAMTTLSYSPEMSRIKLPQYHESKAVAGQLAKSKW